MKTLWLQFRLDGTRAFAVLFAILGTVHAICLLILQSEVPVQHQFTAETTFCFHDGSGGSCCMTIYAQRLRFPSCCHAGMECLAAQSLYGTIIVIIPAAAEDPPFPSFLLFWFISRTFLRDIGVYF